MTLLWPAGQPIAMTCDEAGGPSRFAWQGQTHRVETVAQQWRVDLGWWQERRWRAYYKLSTDSGLLAIVFQDLVSKSWFLQRLYD